TVSIKNAPSIRTKTSTTPIPSTATLRSSTTTSTIILARSRNTRLNHRRSPHFRRRQRLRFGGPGRFERVQGWPLLQRVDGPGAFCHSVEPVPPLILTASGVMPVERHVAVVNRRIVIVGFPPLIGPFEVESARHNGIFVLVSQVQQSRVVIHEVL